MSGIYCGVDSVDYYSINKLSNMTFEERVGILEEIKLFPENVYVVVENKLVIFSNYKNIEDIINNGIDAGILIDLYSIVNNVETGSGTYPNGTMLERISIVNLPKIVYGYGDEFDFTGIEVKGFNLDGTTENIEVFKEDFTGFDSFKPGYSRITLTILGRVAYFDIIVGNSIVSADFKVEKTIDILKLKILSAVIKTTSDIKKVNLYADGGITPGSYEVVSGKAIIPKIVIDSAVSYIDVEGLDYNGDKKGDTLRKTLQ